jgi:hypothetical protein
VVPLALGLKAESSKLKAEGSKDSPKRSASKVKRSFSLVASLTKRSLCEVHFNKLFQ